MKRLVLVLILFALGGAGCAEEASGRIRWSLGGMSCQEAGVTTVRVFLGPLGPGAYDRDIDCELGMEQDGAELPGVAPGRYTLVLKGFGGERMRYAATLDVDVPEGGDLGTIPLEPYTPPTPSPAQW